MAGWFWGLAQRGAVCRAWFAGALGAAIFSVAGIPAATFAADDRILGEFDVAGWDAFAYAATDGTFSHCVAESTYNSRITLLIYVFRDLSWQLGFARDTWNFPKDRPVATTLQIDGGRIWKGNADAVRSDALTIRLPLDQELIDQFKFGRTMTMTFDTLQYMFDLDGTSQLMPRMSQCVRDYVNKTVAVATPPAKTPAPSGSNSQPPKVGTTPAPAATAKHGTATGTGMILTVSGHIVTNNHVVNACTELTVTRPGEPAVPATMVVRDEANDLALLKASIAIAEADVGRLRLGRPVPAGERIAVFGFPLSSALSSNGNIVEGNVAAVSGLGNDTASLQISAPVQPGNSGGPLLDFSAAIVGVVNATIDPITVAKLVGTLPQNINFAIKANVLAAFLESHSVPFEVAASAPQLDLVGVASAARKFTVLITCRY